MPLKLYKRRHSDECLAILKERFRNKKMPDLSQYKGCSCAWWVGGTNDYGLIVPRQTTKATTYDAACAALKKFNQPVLEKEAPRITLKDALLHWRKYGLDNLAPNTLSNYRRAAEEFIVFVAALGIHRMDEVTPDAIRKMRDRWGAEGLKRTTKNLHRTCLNVWFKYAFLQDWIEANPFLKVPAQKKPKDDPEEEACTLPIDDEGERNWLRVQAEVIPFLEQRNYRNVREGSVRHHPANFLALLELMYHTGLRVSDATVFDPRRIVSTPHGGKYTTKQIKTGAYVTVFLEPWLASKLKALPALSPNGQVFYHGSGDLQDYINADVRTPLRELGESLGFKETLRPHRFRDSFAINRINEGIALHDLSVLLGHKSVSTTEQHYLPWVKSREIALEKRLYATRKVVEMPLAAAG